MVVHVHLACIAWTRLFLEFAMIATRYDQSSPLRASPSKRLTLIIQDPLPPINHADEVDNSLVFVLDEKVSSEPRVSLPTPWFPTSSRPSY